MHIPYVMPGGEKMRAASEPPRDPPRRDERSPEPEPKKSRRDSNKEKEKKDKDRDRDRRDKNHR